MYFQLLLEQGTTIRSISFDETCHEQKITWGLTYCWQYFKACSKTEEDDSELSAINSSDSPEVDYEQEKQQNASLDIHHHEKPRAVYPITNQGSRIRHFIQKNVRIPSQSVAWLNGQAWRDLETVNGPTAGLSLIFQVSGFIQLVGGESNSYAFLYFFSLSLVGEVPSSQPFMTSLQKGSKRRAFPFVKQYFRLRDLLTRATILRERWQSLTEDVPTFNDNF